MSQQYGLTWGALDFMSTTPSSDGFLVEAMADGTNFGNPEAQFEIVRSLLTDGSLAVLQGWDNREAPIRLRFSAPSAAAGPALAAAERKLMEQILAESKSPLVYTPAAADSATCVFDVVAAKLERDTSDGWDADEIQREFRYYLLTLTCLPFAHPPNPVTVEAIPVPPPTPTSFTVDDCTVLTNWAGSAQGFGTVTRTNLVTNPSWEGTQAGWTAGANTQYSWTNDPEGMFVGTGAGEFRPSSGTASFIYSSAMTAAAGASYTASVYVRETINVTGFTVNIQWLNSANAVIGEVGSASVNPTAAWQRVSHTAVAPSNAAKATVVLRATGTGWTNVDAALFEQSATLNAYFDGTTADAGGVQYTWTGTANASTSNAYTPPSPTVVTDRIRLTSPPVATNESRTLTLTRSAAVSMTGTPYLRVSMTGNGTSSITSFHARIGTGTASAVTPVAVVPSSIAGVLDYYYSTGDFDRFVAEITASSGTTGPTATIDIAHIERTDTIAGIGSTRQQARTAEVSGSAPTQAAIQLFDETPAALGTEILVHSSRNTSWQPNLRARAVSSATVTTDTAMVSGARNTLTSAMTFRIAASLLTEGTYSLMARMNVTVAGTLTWQARMVSSSGAATVGSSKVITGTASLAVTSGYQVATLGSLALPVVAVEDDQMVELVLTGTANMTFDEGWLFGLDDGALTWVRDSDSLTWVEIRSPELGATRPSVYGGTGAFGDNSSCVDWKCEAFGAHRFDPGLMQVFTVTTTSLVSQSELEFYPRYHSHVEGVA